MAVFPEGVENPHHKSIRSFVRRESRMTPAQTRALEQHWKQYGLELKNGMVDLSSVFGRKAPCILEIGFGMGDSLFTQAELHPDYNYIGIEVHKPGVGKLLAKLVAHQITNVRVYCEDAVEVLACCIPDYSLDNVQIFFPDPWPKKRHHKRRLIQPEFVNLVRSKLKIGGALLLATDWEDYARQMLDVLTHVPGFINAAGHQQFAERPTLRPETKFEKRGRALGHSVWDLTFIRKC